jgi:hypothetical protein
MLKVNYLNKVWSWAMLFSAIPLLAQAQQQCNGHIHFATPDTRYTVTTPGTITDKRSGLMWMRCPLGYSFSDNGTPDILQDDHCTLISGSTGSYTWTQALQARVDLNQAGGYAGYTDWRVPNFKELDTIVETGCVNPTINLTTFPDTLPVAFYTSSAQFPSGNPISYPRTILFSSGAHQADYSAVLGSHVATFVRLVR